MGQAAGGAGNQGDALLALYDAALADVYGYLLRRCGSAAIAEDLTSETLIAAVDAVQHDRVPSLTTAWLIGVARHKLADHWRRTERAGRLLEVAEGSAVDASDDWDAVLDSLLAHEALSLLAPHHRGALTLRYLDGLSVAEVARLLGRTLGATEVLLVRARRAFREIYEPRSERVEDDR